jgi:hypothetical protein
MVFSLNELRHERAGTLKDQPAAMSGEILLRDRLSGNGHPSSAKNPGPDLARTERFYWLTLPHSREAIDVHVLQRQGGLDTNVKILSYEDSYWPPLSRRCYFGNDRLGNGYKDFQRHVDRVGMKASAEVYPVVVQDRPVHNRF